MPDKTRSLTWPFYCECFGDLVFLQVLVESMPSLCCDYGVEHIIPRMAPFALRDLFPFSKPKVVEPDPDDMFEDLAEVRVEDHGLDPSQNGPCVSLDGMIPAVGLIHEIHNMSNDLGNSMKFYKRNIAKMKHIAKMLREPEEKRHLLGTCYSSPEGKLRAECFKRFSGRVVKDRWATVSDCAVQTCEVEDSLRWGWNRERFDHGHKDHGEAEEHGGGKRSDDEDSDDDYAKRKSNIDLVSSAVDNVGFWGWLGIFKLLGTVILRLFLWLSSCPCHFAEDLLDDLPASLLGVWSKCCFKGRRAAELANGDLLACAASELHKVKIKSLGKCRADLSDRERQEILADFECARSHIIFRLSMKLHHWEQPPPCIRMIGTLKF